MYTTLLLIIAAIAFVTLVSTSLYMGFVAARSNGWRELTARYRYRGRAPRGRLRFQSATLNEYTFPGTMQLAATEEGLWLKAMLLWFHPPILVPWRELESTRLHNRFESGVHLQATVDTRFGCELTDATRGELLASTDEAWGEARRALLVHVPVSAPAVGGPRGPSGEAS
ncbi:MAG: hypothetical protein AAGM22_01815 [Acidobacteriota bacterium]